LAVNWSAQSVEFLTTHMSDHTKDQAETSVLFELIGA
jgi:hypothetical protein